MFKSILLITLLLISAHAQAPLTGTVWELQSFSSEGEVTTISNPGNYTLELAPDSDAAGILADCNCCGGTYIATDDSFSVSQIFCTMMACMDSHDDAYTSALNDAFRWKIAGPTLYLVYNGGTAKLQ